MSEGDGEQLWQRAFSYIRRRGRMTKGQARGFSQLSVHRFVTEELTGVPHVGLEIGFGMGHALLDWATQREDWLIVGVELYEPGIGAALLGIERLALTNLRLATTPAQILISTLPASCLDEVRIFFPDPWPKKRHHKRRLIQDEFLQNLSRVLKPDATVHMATDWAPYAEWMRDCIAAQDQYQLVSDRVRSADHSDDTNIRSSTNFERRGERLGHDICDLVIRRR